MAGKMLLLKIKKKTADGGGMKLEGFMGSGELWSTGVEGGGE